MVRYPRDWAGSVPESRTVFILTSEPPEGGGGAEHFVRELVKGLKTRGYRTEVFHRVNSEPPWLAGLSGRLGKKLAGTLRGYWIGRNAQWHISGDVAAVISNSDVGVYRVRHATPFRRILSPLAFHYFVMARRSDAL
jgi:hypothetical protein